MRCLDRLYRNAYGPRLQTPGGVSGCLVRACHQQIASPARFAQLTTAFKTRLRAWATERDIPWIAFRNGQRKDQVVEPYRAKRPGRAGGVLIGVAQDRASAWAATKKQTGRFGDFAFFRKAVYVNHYYIYLLDPEWTSSRSDAPPSPWSVSNDCAALSSSCRFHL